MQCTKKGALLLPPGSYTVIAIPAAICLLCIHKVLYIADLST